MLNFMQIPASTDDELKYKNFLTFSREVTIRYLLWVACNKHTYTPSPSKLLD